MENWIKIGKVLKTKGFDGTMIVRFDYPVLEDNFKAFFIQKNQQFLPLLIEKKEELDEESYLIKWSKYPTKEAAQTLHNQDLYIAQNIAETHFDFEAMEDFTGYEVYNFDDKLGVVSDILESNFQETLEVKLANEKTLLIPFIDEFIETIDDEKKAIYCQLSDEFIEMFTT